MSEMVEILSSEVGVGKPILTSDILCAYEGAARSGVFAKIDAALQAGDLARFGRGVYYIPEPSVIPGLDMPLSPESVLQKKYISNGIEVYGFRSGLALLNDCGVSNQVPAVLEITTNKSPRRVYTIKPIGGYREIVLRKPRVPVEASNVLELQALNALGMSDLDALMSNEFDALMKMINSCDRRKLFSIAQHYPAKIMSKLMKIESARAIPA